MKQDKNTPVAVGCQVAIIYAAVHNLMKDIELENIREYEKELYSHMTLEHRKLMKRFADGYYEESDQKSLRRLSEALLKDLSACIAKEVEKLWVLILKQ